MTVLIITVAVLVTSAAISFNRFVEQRSQIRNSWADIEAELKRRHDLIPNLVASVQAYASHERQIFDDVARARSAATGATGGVQQASELEMQLVTALRQVLVVSEAYPQLRASQNFLALQSQLANTEDRIEASRRFYNANVQTYNRRIQSVPSNLIASIFNFGPEPFFTAEPAERQSTVVQLAPAPHPAPN